jgi:hypothetical protein
MVEAHSGSGISSDQYVSSGKRRKAVVRAELKSMSCVMCSEFFVSLDQT